MKALFDTSLIIPAEPTGPDDIEADTPIVVEVIRLLNEGGHQIYLHPASLEELTHDRNPVRRAVRETLLGKYLQLPSPPPVPAALEQVIGTAAPGSHDAVDHVLLAAVHRDAVDLLVTADRQLHKKAGRARLGERVFTPDDCAAMLRGLFSKLPLPPPAVEAVLAYQLDESDPTFLSFREDYVGFDQWLQKCKREHRRTWVIRRPGGLLDALCIVKREAGGEHGVPGPALKICSFKVSEQGRGFRFGELLLKTVFVHAFSNRYAAIYVTILPQYEDLILLFQEFGFVVLDQRTKLNEYVLMKRLVFTSDELQRLAPLEFNVRFGPEHVKLGNVPSFVVPIRPTFHRRLFPEAECQRTFFAGREPFGNSIAKAYLCNAPTRKIEPGSLLLFYRSQDAKHVQSVGVAEETIVSQEAATIARFVGKRTVYPYDEIEGMCAKPTLAIRFRQARILTRPLGLAELVQNGVLRRAPQSIARVREEGRGWLRDQMERSH